MYLQAMVENLKSHDSGFIDKADFVKLCTVRGGWRGSVRRGMVVRRMVVRRLGNLEKYHNKKKIALFRICDFLKFESS